MNKQDFVTKFYPFAKQAAQQTGIPVLFALGQSALESGWGKHAPGNMLFGIKVGSGNNFGGWTGKRQLITTTEYSSRSNLNFPFIYEGYPKRIAGGKWKYRIKDYFRAYPTPLEAFLDWGGLLSKAKRYRPAMSFASDPYRFAEKIIKAGYATDPNYVSKVTGIMQDIESLLPEEERKGSRSPILPSKENIKRNLLPLLLISSGMSLVLFTILSR